MAMSTDVEREYLTPRAVGKIIGVRIELIHRWIHDGELPASDISRRGARKRRFVVHRDAVDEFMRARSVHADRPVRTPKRRLPDVPQYV